MDNFLENKSLKDIIVLIGSFLFFFIIPPTTYVLTIAPFDFLRSGSRRKIEWLCPIQIHTKPKNSAAVVQWISLRWLLASSLATGPLLFTVRYLVGRQKPPRQVQVLSAAIPDVPDGKSLLAKDLSGRKFLLVRSSKGVRAFSTKCTHLRCQVHWKPEDKTFSALQQRCVRRGRKPREGAAPDAVGLVRRLPGREASIFVVAAAIVAMTVLVLIEGLS